MKEIGASSGPGGIDITYDGPEDGVVVNGGLEDPATGYSAGLHFARPLAPSARVKKMTYAELGLMVGIADPMMNFPKDTIFSPYTVVRNIEDKSISVIPTLYWMENGAARSAVLQPQTVLPHKSQSIDVMGLIAAAGLKNYNGAVNLILETEHKSQGLIIAAGSVDQKNTYVFEVTSRPIAQSASKGVSYWNTRDGNDTMVTVWNPADETQDFLFTLNFSGGHYALPVHLEPRATREFNVSEIIHTQVPDAEGNIIPASVHEGSAMVSGVHGENELILVAVEAGIYNVRKATCADIVCSTCHGETAGDVVEDPFGVAVSGTHQLHFLVTYDTGHQYDYTGGSQWTSNHANIATVGSGSGNVTGVSPGSVTITAIAAELPEYSVACYPGNLQPPECGVSDFVGEGGGNVFQVTSVSPSPIVVGSGGRMVIRGSGFSTQLGTLSVNVDGAGVSVTNPSLGGDRDHEIIATYNVAGNAPVGSRNLAAVFTQGETQVFSNPFPLPVTAASQGTVTGISPAQGLIGTTVSNVTISGSGFGSTPTVFAGTGVTVTYASRNNTQIVANFAIASTAPAGNHSVVVTTTAGAQLAPVNFFVQVPTHIQLFNQPPEAPGGRGPVISVVNGTIYQLDGSIFALNQCGVYENFAFDIADQLGTEITNGTVYVTEVFSNITNPPGPSPRTNFAVNLTTQGYEDLHARSHTFPTCLAYNENQAYDLTWTVKVGSVNATAYPVATSVHITKGNFSGTLNVTLTVTTP